MPGNTLPEGIVIPHYGRTNAGNILMWCWGRVWEQLSPGMALGTVVPRLAGSRDVTLGPVHGGTLWKATEECLPRSPSLRHVSLAAGRAVGSFEGGKS